ncbi:MAG: Smr/MutS family protein [Treponema sp.]|jgi:DNA-nicking Smr family endonuclease|nr:Smr/MutS family protein [Treponema sp.]
MDFGAILEQWEGETGSSPAFRSGGRKTKKPAERAGRDEEKAPLGNAALSLIRWLNTNGVYDKDAEEEDLYLSPGEKRRRLLTRKPDAEIDLHGLSRDEAWASLENFFAHARRMGFLKISVIHGKGNHSEGEAVLKRAVREFIERCPFAGQSGHRDPRSGGNGATWVLLKGD